MKLIIKRAGLILLFALAGIHTVLADQTQELLNVMNQAMLEPCNSQPYLACLGLKQDFCRKQVGLSVKHCNSKYPVEQVKDNQQEFFQAFGNCMQTQIIGRLKLSQTMLNKCEAVLRESLPKG